MQPIQDTDPSLYQISGSQCVVLNDVIARVCDYCQLQVAGTKKLYWAISAKVFQPKFEPCDSGHGTRIILMQHEAQIIRRFNINKPT